MMGSNDGNQVLASWNHEADFSEPTVEIKIKTLDSQTYTLRVDKCVPVPELKEQIASVTGVVSEHQRLICRGRVLKDDQLLSAYHVEDGHTLHLVVRQPIPPLSDSLPGNTASDRYMDHGNDDSSRAGPRIFVGTFNISREPDGTAPAVNQILATLLSSIVNRNGSGGTNSREPSIEQLPRLPDLIGSRDSSRPQPSQATLNPPQPPVLADSLTTMSQFLSHLRDEFGAVANGSNSQNAGSTNVQGSDAALRSAAIHTRSSRPGTFAEMLRSTRQLLVEQAADCMDHLAQQLEDQENVTNTVTRSSIQMNGLRSGNLLHNLGALLLELGRVTTRIEMGQTPDDAVVNAGPPIYVSGSGPNPIMIQPLPYRTNLGANPTRTSEGTTNAEASTLSVIADERESNSSETSAAASSDSSPTSRLGAFRLVPVRTVVASISASFARPSLESSQTSVANVTRGQHPNSDSRNSDSNFPSPTTNFLAQDAAASNEETTPRVSDEGDFLSNVLHRILPFMPRNMTTGSGVASERDTGERETSSTQGPESGRGPSSRRRRRRTDPAPPPSSDKRQKRR